jgi:hypothetical protein
MHINTLNSAAPQGAYGYAKMTHTPQEIYFQAPSPHGVMNTRLRVWLVKGFSEALIK